MSHRRFPHVNRLRLGYHRRQVDAFLNRVEVAIAGGLPTPTAVEVRQAGFELVHGGYRVEVVDEHLDELEDRVLELQDHSPGRRGRIDPAAEATYLVGELSRPYARRFDRARWLSHGYHPDDVDDFLDRALATLDGRGGASPVTVEQVRSAPFRPHRGGYVEEAVDDALDKIVEHLLLVRRQTAGAGEDGHLV